MDLRCECPGADTRHVQCESQADGEDGLCSNCRERDCPNSPLAYLMKATQELIDSGQPYTPHMFDHINTEYLRRCQEQGVQP